jgi:hypothetical protein
MEKSARAVLPSRTVTARVLEPLTVQFEATPESATTWAPLTTANLALPLVAIDLLWTTSTVTV